MGFSSMVASGLAGKLSKIVKQKLPEAISSGSMTQVGSTAAPVSAGANNSITNRAMGMQSKGVPQAASGNLGVVSQGMVNTEVQNDDMLDPIKFIGM
jgi:hypothetical protein